MDQLKSDVDRLVERIATEGKTNNPEAIQLLNIATYVGSGYFDILIKGVANDFKDVRKCIKKIVTDPHLKGLRPTTYLIADVIQESDIVDHTWIEFAESVIDLVTFLGPDSAELIRRLDAKVQIKIGELFSAYGELTGTSFKETLLGIFEARLRDNSRMLAQKLLVLVELEVLLREFLKKSGLTVFGNEFVTEVNAYFDNRHNSNFEASKNTLAPKVKRSLPIDDLSLHDVVVLLGKLSSKSQEFESMVKEKLGDDGLKHLDKLDKGQYRNHLAHGRLHVDPTFLSDIDKWSDLALNVLNIGKIYNSLVEDQP